MDLFSLIEVITVVTVSIVGFILLYQRTSKKNNKSGSYSVPDWNFIIKKYWAKWHLKSKEKTASDYDLDFKSYKSEEYSILETEESSDYHLFYGCDQNGNSLLVKLVKRRNNCSEIWLILRLKNGQTYLFPDHPSTVIPFNYNVNSRKLEAGGLVLECLFPYKTWRITYSGLLAESAPTDGTNNKPPEITKNLKFIKFNFFWSAGSPPRHCPHDWSVDLRAIALATEPWRSGDWMSYLPVPKFGGYDQFGSLLGQVHISKDNEKDPETPEMEIIELNLPGMRQRRFLPAEVTTLRRSANLAGVCRDGSMFVLGSYSFYKNMSQLQFGFVRKPSGVIDSIDWTDFHLARLAEDPNSIPAALNIKFRANKIMYSTTISFRIRTLTQLGGTYPQNGDASVIHTELSVNGERGGGVAVLWYSKSANEKVPFILDDKRSKYLSYSSELPDRGKLANNITDSEASSLIISGGKGASLSLLTKVLEKKSFTKNIQYQVPPGFILSVAALELQIQRNTNLRDLVFHLKNCANGMVAGSLADACQRTCDAFSQTTLEPEIIETITEFYEKLQTNYKFSLNDDNIDFRLAVRSSAIGEDSEDSSSAGQNTTLLGLSSLPAVLDGVRKCWSSLYTFQSVEYRRQHMQPINAQMAVVVQVMIPADCAGVMFTVHPTNGDPSKMLITANYGLGESVVSGNVDPDVYILKRTYKTDELNVIHTRLGKKDHSLDMSNESDSLYSRTLSKVEQDTSCLSAEQILRLAKIGVFLERSYGSCRDVEWAFYKDQIYLLQSRPITTLNNWSNWELFHEFNDPIMSEDDLHTFANVGEVFVDVTTPLSYSTHCVSLNKLIDETLTGIKDRYDGLFSLGFLYLQHRICINVYHVFLRGVSKEIKLADRLAALVVFGNDFFTPKMNKVAIHRYGAIYSEFRLLQVFKSIWINKTLIKQSKKFLKGYIGRYSDENLHEFKSHDAYLFNSNIEFDITDEDRLVTVITAHQNCSSLSVFLQTILLMVLIENSPELRADHYADISLMLASCNDVESAEIPKNIEEISNEIYLSGKSREFADIPVDQGRDWLANNCRSAYRLFNEFIKKNYHRGYKELDLICETWGMNPNIVIGMIQASLKAANKNALNRKSKVELSNADIIERLKTPKKPITKKILAFLLPHCKNAIRRREDTKSCMIAFLHEIRKAYRHLAKLMHQEGLLPNPELIFFFNRQEIAQLLNKQTIASSSMGKGLLIHKAMRRMKLFQSWKSERYNDVNEGLLKPSIKEHFNGTGSSDGILVTGAPVCEGVVKGRACVINSFDQVSEIQAGDILITYCTDVGWSPYFPILSGIVTELGGLLSHGAVVAREYGLPCIIGAAGATSKVQHGDRIVLNAGEGIILKDNEAELLSSMDLA